MSFNKCSGESLEELVKDFCIERGKDEGEIWKRINTIYDTRYHVDMMAKKNEYEVEHNVGDIPMAQWIANSSEVSNTIQIVDEMKNVMI